MSFEGYTRLGVAGSAALLLGALAFQYIGEMPPCKLCYWQRYPHLAVIGLGLVALYSYARTPVLLGAGAALSTAGIGAYHTGVERGWWDGPTSCTSSNIGGLSSEDLMAQIMAAPLVRCDEVPWELFTLSMASWNMLASLVIAALFLLAYRSH